MGVRVAVLGVGVGDAVWGVDVGGGVERGVVLGWGLGLALSVGN